MFYKYFYIGHFVAQCIKIPKCNSKGNDDTQSSNGAFSITDILISTVMSITVVCFIIIIVLLIILIFKRNSSIHPASTSTNS